MGKQVRYAAKRLEKKKKTCCLAKKLSFFHEECVVSHANLMSERFTPSFETTDAFEESSEATDLTKHFFFAFTGVVIHLGWVDNPLSFFGDLESLT